MTMTTAALLSSCGLYKSYERPADIQVDDLYRSENVQSGDSLGLAALGWKEVFTDPKLQALIERGLAQNTNMLSAQLQIEQAEASLKAAKWAYIPSLALAPQGSLAGVDWGKASQTYTIPATASWQLDIFGSLHNAKKRAKAQLANSEAFRQAVQSQLIAAIANYYYSLAMLNDQLAISTETEKLWQYFKRTYPKIQAFDYNGICEILTIQPQDIGLLPRETWGYGNNSFLLHGYYSHRYLILARLKGSKGKDRFLLGVPGHYYSSEKYMASMFGFPNFVLSKMQPAGDGRFGYWYTDLRLHVQ